MKAAGIIAEFNPIHNGHRYLMQEARRITGADYIVVMMSGSFVQRGEPAICGKHLRARMALAAGADAVLELPAPFSVASAEYFASAGVSLLSRTGVVEDLVFGAECDDPEKLKMIARVLRREPKQYKLLLKQGLKEGHSFPAARAEALGGMGSGLSEKIPDLAVVMSASNNILAIEYLKALSKLNSPLKPHVVRRIGADYRDLKYGMGMPSSLALRTAMAERGSCESFREQMPEESYRLLHEAFNEEMPLYPDDFSLLLRYKLLMEKDTDLTRYADLSRTLSDRIRKNLPEFESFSQFASVLKTKDRTYSRVSRVLLHILLGFTGESLRSEIVYGSDGYLRVLGFKEGASGLIRAMRANASVPVLTRPAEAKKVLTGASYQAFCDTARASDLYRAVLEYKYHKKLPHEMIRKAEKSGGTIEV